MYVVYGHIRLHLPYSSSLKTKRQSIQSIITRVRKRFSISMSEVDDQDLWQSSQLGFAAVCRSDAEMQIILNAIQKTLDQYDDIEVLSFSWDVLVD